MFQIESAQPNDRGRLNQLLHHSLRTHTHLDWHAPQGWLGTKPFFLAVKKEQTVAALAAPPSPIDTSWLRLAVVLDNHDPFEILDPLWQPTLETLRELKTERIACMLLNEWLIPLLQHWAFTQINDVVVLQRHAGARLPTKPKLNGIKVRPAKASDTEIIYQVDAAFSSPWRYSLETLLQAMKQVEFTSVAELNGEIVGYQISSGGRSAGHLARLAVRPEYQGKGVGQALMHEIVKHFEHAGAPYITVNTQHDNHSSLALYQSFGFELTGEHYPVWMRNVN